MTLAIETPASLTMKKAKVGMLVKVSSLAARNPGGYGRITAREPKKGLVRVDSGEFPGQEVTGWYPVGSVEPYTLPIPAEGKHTAYDNVTHDHLMYLDGQFIGAARTETEANATLDTLVDEIARHTRATTADMAAERAAEREATSQSAPPRTIDELRDELDAVTDAILEHKRSKQSYDNLCVLRQQIIRELDVAHEAARQAQDPADDSGSPIEPDPVEYPSSTEPQPVEDLPPCDGLYVEPCYKPARHSVWFGMVLRNLCDECMTAWRRDYEDDTAEQIATIAPNPFAGDLLLTADERGPDPVFPTCASCGDPSDGLCPACQESGESVGTIDDLGLPDHIVALLVGTSNPRCKVCGVPAEVSAGDELYCKPCWHGPNYAALVDPGEAAADPLDDVLAPPDGLPEPCPLPSDDEPDEEARTCRACGQSSCPGVVSIQRGGAIRAALEAPVVTERDRAEMRALAISGTRGKIQAIKRWRELTGSMLGEAKESIERLMSEPTPEQHDPCADVRRELDEARTLLKEAGDALGWLQSFYNDVSNTAPEYFERCGDLNAVTYLMNEAANIREQLSAALGR